MAQNVWLDSTGSKIITIIFLISALVLSATYLEILPDKMILFQTETYISRANDMWKGAGNAEIKSNGKEHKRVSEISVDRQISLGIKLGKADGGVSEVASGLQPTENLTLTHEEVPHVLHCNLCFACHIEKPAKPLQQIPYELQEQVDRLMDLDESSIWKQIPEGQTDFKIFHSKDRKSKTNCSECHGCLHDLMPVSTTTDMFNQSYGAEVGASPAWSFRVTKGPMAEKSSTGAAVVKVWCVPVWKKLQLSYAQCHPPNDLQTVQKVLALDKVVGECGFESIVPRAWTGPVYGVIKGTGYYVDWDGLWFDAAPGISLESFLKRASRARTSTLKLLKNINSTEVVLAALFDLLTFQVDRHAQNVFIDENGKLTLIDNEQWLGSGVNSLFLPTSEKYAINQVGFGYTHRPDINQPIMQPNVQVMLDYRCHVEDGTLGTEYPPKMKECMTRLTQMSLTEIQQHYRFPDTKFGQELQSRARDMLEHGFEWTLQHGQPRSPPHVLYPWYSQCCSFSEQFKCLDDWDVDTRLPPL